MIIDEEIMARVNSYAKRMMKRNLPRFLDAEDIRQELLCELIISLKSFDKSKGEFSHFVNNVLRKRYLMLLEKYGRAKNGRNIFFSEYKDNLYFCENPHHKTLQLLDLEKAVTCLPMRYQNAISLLKTCCSSKCGISEILETTCRPRSSVYADIKRAKDIIRIYLSDRKYCRFNNKIGGIMKSISILETLSVKEISALDIADLMDLNDQITNLNSQAKDMRQKLDDGLNLRFAETVKANLRSQSKDTGTTRFMDSGFQIIAEVPKKVTWDSEMLSEIMRKMPLEKQKLIIKTVHSVEEKKYAELPHEDQMALKPARTVIPGKTRFQIIIGDQP